ncbi:MAG: hypothetical protein Q9191_001848 [Dirinaria sp. TL-2023a]
MAVTHIVEINGKAAITNESNAKEVDQKPRAKSGMTSDVKSLYEGKPDDRGKTTWVDKYPDDLEEAAENAESACYALLIRNTKCYDGRRKLQMDSVTVQSPLLKKAFAEALSDYPGVTVSLDRLTFKAPFKPFVHRWAKIKKALEDETDPETKAHLELFHRVMGDELQDDLKARDDYISNKVITYDTCWMIFEPGTIVFGLDDKQDCAFRLTNGNYINTQCGPAFALDCERVDWDGESFGLESKRLLIYQFLGTRPITQLTAFPLDYHQDLENVKKALVERGKVFERFSGYHYKHYRGVAVGYGAWGPVKYDVDSRIIIDTYAWNRFNPNRQVFLNNLNRSQSPANTADDEDSVQDEDTDYGDDDLDGEELTTLSQPGEFNPKSLTKDQLLLCSATLRGYSLKNKKWLIFAVAAVDDMKWNDGAFESLVLPSNHKELILALTESQVADKESFDDVIQGKGKGMIMLLSGPPGVGKTLTAESVAENMHVPLYMMSAGDLGLESSGVESSLSNVLEMCTKWNAVLLLDEADVFLEQRSAHDLERNKLVSIFLRMLEYYEGILFLTTNRVDNIDAAFQSRIHLSMEYSELSKSSRRHVWVNFLCAGGTKAHGFSDADLDRLVGYDMNGREIKNVLKTAKLLAGKKKESLGVSHVETVVAIEKRHIKNEGETQVKST